MELSKEAAGYGADGVLVVTPYYNKATQKGMIAHFTQVADAAKIPVVLYNIPGRTGCKMEAETVAYLVNHVDNIVAIKEASGDFSNIVKMMDLTDGKLDLYSGNDDQIVPLMSLGGKGVISVLSNVAPQAAHDICQLYLDGKVKESLELQLKALPLIHALFSEVNPIPVKKAVELMGLCGGTVRAPLTELEPEHTEILKKRDAEVRTYLLIKRKKIMELTTTQKRQRLLTMIFGAIAIFFTGYPHVWSIYQPYVMEQAGWSQTAASMCFYHGTEYIRIWKYNRWKITG